eukprot:9832146-Prorocentrum_lima.AAC.1
MVLAHEDATSGGLAVHTSQLIQGVLDKDLSAVTVSEVVVPDRMVREWLNAECGLHLVVHAGRTS